MRVAFARIDRVGDMTAGAFDVDLPSGARVSLSGFRDRSGRVVIRGLRQIVDREAQDAAAAAVRAALEADADRETGRTA